MAIHFHEQAQRGARARFGIGLRRPYFDALASPQPGIDFVEIITENFMNFGGRPRTALNRTLDHMPVLPHGVGLSIGGPDPLRDDYLKSLRGLLNHMNPPWFSDHLSYSSAFGVEYHDLIPLPFSEYAARHAARRAAEVQDRMDRPFLLENPTYYARMPGSEMSEAAFISEVVTQADCGLLLDINNVWVNSQNHGYDPYAFVDALPLDRVRQIHMAGHDSSGELIIDTHGAPAIDEVLALYGYVAPRTPEAWTLFEWDHDLPPLSTLLEENARVRAAFAKAMAGEGN